MDCDVFGVPRRRLSRSEANPEARNNVTRSEVIPLQDGPVITASMCPGVESSLLLLL